ncbi:velvet factor [Collybia nuda]|uniref:Velvet factor n=1 Tax=Collybia nuda TaxID=64659 RepID=A0A9P6CLL3_9AGAR|nr:velvet factor [Collybia nuda]
MIQQLNARQMNTALAPPRQAAHDGPEEWGQWSGRKHYSLEVVQHPLRARMCGFGDKDRRPLAPAAVAKMIVRRDDNSLVDVDDVDCSFFLVTVDLWSPNGKQEMNLVLHPSSTDRYAPAHSSKTKRRGTSTSAPHPRSAGNQTPTSRTTPTPAHYRAGEQVQSAIATPSLLPQATAYNNQYFPPAPDTMSFPPPAPYVTPTQEVPTWGYNAQSPHVDRNTSFPPPILPSIHSFGRSPINVEPWQSEGDPEILPYRAWGSDSTYSSVDNFVNSQVDPALRTSPSNNEGRDASAWPQTERYTHEGYPPPAPPQLDTAIYATTPTTYNQPVAPAQPPYYPSHYPSHNGLPSSAGSGPPPPRHTYTRTLVGPLSANACRLLDEHRKPGIFFLFQDLSVRTEGTFRLRLRLMNVGAPPAPESGAIRVHNDVSPVLAQTFTEPFVVFSAKRFPGVPDTTALSIAFGNQGQKLPLVGLILFPRSCTTLIIHLS